MTQPYLSSFPVSCRMYHAIHVKIEVVKVNIWYSGRNTGSKFHLHLSQKQTLVDPPWRRSGGIFSSANWKSQEHPLSSEEWYSIFFMRREIAGCAWRVWRQDPNNGSVAVRNWHHRASIWFVTLTPLYPVSTVRFDIHYSKACERRNVGTCEE